MKIMKKIANKYVQADKFTIPYSVFREKEGTIVRFFLIKKSASERSLDQSNSQNGSAPQPQQSITLNYDSVGNLVWLLRATEICTLLCVCGALLNLSGNRSKLNVPYVCE